MTDSQEKNYPVTTPEIAEMFGLKAKHTASLPVEHASNVSGVPEDFAHIVGNLYVKDEHASEAKEPAKAHGKPVSGVHKEEAHEEFREPASFDNMGNALRSITPYVVVFSVALFLYFFFFGSMTFGFDSIKSWTRNSTAKVETPKEDRLSDLKTRNMDAYNAWISGFYYDVSDPKVLDPDADNSGNGLSNFQKFLLNLNPKSYDTVGLGLSDSETLNKGTNPLSGGKLTDAQKAIVEKYIDMEVVMNRLALAQLQKNGTVAGAAVNSAVQVPTGGYNSFPNVNTQPQNNPAAAPAQPVSSQPIVNIPMADGLEINTDIPGRVEIPSLKINVPLMWTKDPKNFDKDLQSGVVHYPGTALPGQIGTTYVSGHSSNYAWAKGNYNQVFSKLGDLADNTSFKVTVVQKNGKDAVLHYVVVGREEYKPTDQAQFKNTGKSLVALSTCWPVGSTAKRLVVFGELTQVVK